jgi:hypothetical protein
MKLSLHLCVLTLTLALTHSLILATAANEGVSERVSERVSEGVSALQPKAMFSVQHCSTSAFNGM